MNSRDVILGRLRAALAGAPPPAVTVPRDYLRDAELPPDRLLDLLTERLTDYRAEVHHCRDAEVAATVATVLAGRPVIVPAGLPPHWLPSTAAVVPSDGLDARQLAAVEAVVTGATVAVAETGTVVIDGSAGQGPRLFSLLPDLHICVVRPEQVVGTVPEALARLDPRRPLTWISGPSATSDIELNRVEGVHGPRNLHVILLRQPA